MASVTFKRGTRAEIEATAKQDGQILMETDQNKKNKMYIDLPDGRRVLIGNSGEAIDTSYDNTTSGLDATNVQNAIDKIENNVGDISGITDSLTATSSNIALSAAGGNNLQGQIDTLNSSLVEYSFSDWISAGQGVIYRYNKQLLEVIIENGTQNFGQWYTLANLPIKPSKISHTLGWNYAGDVVVGITITTNGDVNVRTLGGNTTIGVTGHIICSR